MLYTFRNRFHRARLDKCFSAVTKVPPARFTRQSDAIVVSQLRGKDVLMYLVAVKSFVSRTPIRAAYVVNDGSLGEHDIQLLRWHVPGVTVVGLEEFRSPQCPVGGTWERLLAIAELVRENYVIQLDSDTVTLGQIQEVDACIADGTSFTIGTWDGQAVEKMQIACERAKGLISEYDTPHVQLAAEANFDRFTEYHSLRYVRGCSGFAGFARDSFNREFVEDFSEAMRRIIGEKWEQWGSEQTMSNMVVANAPDSAVLPHPEYCNCERIDESRTRFIHFVGNCRFRRNDYAKQARAVIETLGNDAQITQRG